MMRVRAEPGREGAAAADGLILNLGGISAYVVADDIQHTHSILYLFAYTILFKTTLKHIFSHILLSKISISVFIRLGITAGVPLEFI